MSDDPVRKGDIEPADNLQSSDASKKDALEADTTVIYQLYLEGFITVHELDIMLQDLDSEYRKRYR